MPEAESILRFLGLIVVVGPLLLTMAFGISSLLDRKMDEAKCADGLRRDISGLVASVAVLVGMLAMGTRHIAIGPWNWVVIPGIYHFSVKFVFDRLSVPFASSRSSSPGRSAPSPAATCTASGGTPLLRSVRDLRPRHGDHVAGGDDRDALCGVGLVGYRPPPGRLLPGTFRAVAERALGMGHLSGLRRGAAPGRRGDAPPERRRRLRRPPGRRPLAGSACVGDAGPGARRGAAAPGGRCGEVGPGPVLGLAPEGDGRADSFQRRVLRGPVGALGGFLLLRASPLLALSTGSASPSSPWGWRPRVFAHLAGSVQTDIKSALSFASLSQVGLIVAEIGLGFRYVALVHILGHACLRTLQFVGRRPSARLSQAGERHRRAPAPGWQSLGAVGAPRATPGSIASRWSGAISTPS